MIRHEARFPLIPADILDIIKKQAASEVPERKKKGVLSYEEYGGYRKREGL